MTAARKITLEFPSLRDFLGQYGDRISAEGMLLQVDPPPEAGSEVDVEVVLGDGLPLLRARGETLWRGWTGTGRRQYGAAIRFHELDEASKTLIAKVVEQRRRDGEPEFELSEAPPPRGSRLRDLTVPAAEAFGDVSPPAEGTGESVFDLAAPAAPPAELAAPPPGAPADLAAPFALEPPASDAGPAAPFELEPPVAALELEPAEAAPTPEPVETLFGPPTEPLSEPEEPAGLELEPLEPEAADGEPPAEVPLADAGLSDLFGGDEPQSPPRGGLTDPFPPSFVDEVEAELEAADQVEPVESLTVAFETNGLEMPEPGPESSLAGPEMADEPILGAPAPVPSAPEPSPIPEPALEPPAIVPPTEPPAVGPPVPDPLMAESPTPESPTLEPPTPEPPLPEPPGLESSTYEAPPPEAALPEAQLPEAPMLEAPMLEAPMLEAAEPPTPEPPTPEPAGLEPPMPEPPTPMPGVSEPTPSAEAEPPPADAPLPAPPAPEPGAAAPAAGVPPAGEPPLATPPASEPVDPAPAPEPEMPRAEVPPPTPAASADAARPILDHGRGAETIELPLPKAALRTRGELTSEPPPLVAGAELEIPELASTPAKAPAVVEPGPAAPSAAALRGAASRSRHFGTWLLIGLLAAALAIAGYFALGLFWRGAQDGEQTATAPPQPPPSEAAAEPITPAVPPARVEPQPAEPQPQETVPETVDGGLPVAPETPPAESSPTEPEAPETAAAEPEPQPALAAWSGLDQITWRESEGETLVTLVADGELPPMDDIEIVWISGDDPRLVLKLPGAQRAFRPAVLEVGTAQVRRIRTGLHAGGQLHLVLDLADPKVVVDDLGVRGSRLSMRLRPQGD